MKTILKKYGPILLLVIIFIIYSLLSREALSKRDKIIAENNAIYQADRSAWESDRRLMEDDIKALERDKDVLGATSENLARKVSSIQSFSANKLREIKADLELVLTEKEKDEQKIFTLDELVSNLKEQLDVQKIISDKWELTAKTERALRLKSESNYAFLEKSYNRVKSRWGCWIGPQAGFDFLHGTGYVGFGIGFGKRIK